MEEEEIKDKKDKNDLNSNNHDFEKELKIAFDVFDKDKSGDISLEEFEEIIKNLGIYISKKELSEMMSLIDNKSDKLDFNSFKNLITKTIHDDNLIQSCIEAFAIFDKNKDGKIKKSEMKIVLEKYCYLCEEDALNLLSNQYFDESNELDYMVFVKETFKLLGKY